MSVTNVVIAWSSLADSAGRKVRDYQLRFSAGRLDVLAQIFGGLAEVVWYFFMFFSTVAGTFLSWVSDPSWLNGIDKFYQSTVARAIFVANPVLLGVIGFALLIIHIAFGKTRSNSSRITSEDINRVAVAVGMLGVISALVAAPFFLLRSSLSLVRAVLSAITGTDVDDVAGSAFSVDAMIRQPHLIIQYGGAVSEKCADLWSKTGNLTAKSGCIESGASTPGAGTLLLAILALVLSASTVLFASLALYKYAKHLTAAVFGFVSVPWVGAVSLFRRRQFDAIGTVLAIAAGHMIMVFAIQLIALVLPLIASSALAAWGHTDYAVLQILSLIACYLVFSAILLVVTSKASPLVNALKANTFAPYLGRMWSGDKGKPTGTPKPQASASSWRGAVDAVNPVAQVRELTRRAVVARDAFGKITRGKFAEKGSGGGDVMDDTTEAQRTLDMGPTGRPTTTVQLGGLLSTSNAPASSQQLALPAGSSAGVEAHATVKEVAGVPSLANTMISMVGADSEVPLADIPTARDVGDRFIADNLVSDDPYVGGLTPTNALINVVNGLSQAVGAVANRVDGTNGILTMMRESGAFNMQTVAEMLTDEGGALFGILEGIQQGNYTMESGLAALHQAVDSETEKKLAAATKSESAATAQRTAMEKIIGHMDRARTRYEKESARLNSTDTAPANASSPTVQVAVNTSNNTVVVSVSPASVSTVGRNALRGGPATPGDVGLTKLNHMCDREAASVAFEETRIERLATGRLGALSVSGGDGRFNVRFSPEGGNRTVRGAFDAGFGDSIF